MIGYLFAISPFIIAFILIVSAYLRPNIKQKKQYEYIYARGVETTAKIVPRFKYSRNRDSENVDVFAVYKDKKGTLRKSQIASSVRQIITETGRILWLPVNKHNSKEIKNVKISQKMKIKYIPGEYDRAIVIDGDSLPEEIEKRINESKALLEILVFFSVVFIISFLTVFIGITMS